jgi:hypothetical protein
VSGNTTGVARAIVGVARIGEGDGIDTGVAGMVVGTAVAEGDAVATTVGVRVDDATVVGVLALTVPGHGTSCPVAWHRHVGPPDGCVIRPVQPDCGVGGVVGVNAGPVAGVRVAVAAIGAAVNVLVVGVGLGHTKLLFSIGVIVPPSVSD